MARLIKIVIALLILHGAWRVGSAYWQNFQFQEALRETALFAGAQSQQAVETRVREIAADLRVPLPPGGVVVRKQGTRTTIEAAYVQEVEVLPRYQYPWPFSVSVEGWSGAAFEQR